MKRLVIHVVIILLLGVGGGILLRTIRKGPQQVAAELRRVVNSQPVVEETAVGPANDESNLINGTQDPAEAVAEVSWLKDFELTERSGKTVSSHELLGKPYVVSFFFSTCPSICVMQNQKLQELQNMFAGQGVKFLSISVDPEIDRPEVLTEYAKRFGAVEDQWLFLTGDLTYIRRVAAEIYQLAADKKFHSEKFVLVGRDGKIVSFFSWNEPRSFDKLKRAITEQLAT